MINLEKFKKIPSYCGALTIAIVKGSNNVKPRAVNHLSFYPEYNLIYNRIPKSGNSSISLYLHDAITKNINYSCEDSYYKSKSKAIQLAKKPSEIFYSPRYLLNIHKAKIFTVIRNPYLRILSAFLQKISTGKMKKYKHIPGFGENTQQGFIKFVNYLEDFGLYKDYHWMPQFEMMAFSENLYDEIIKLEELPNKFNLFINKKGLNVPLEILEKPHIKEQMDQIKITNAKNKVDQFYNKSLKEKIALLYKKDFILGKYLD